MKRLFQDWRWYALIIFLSVAGIMASDIQRGITYSTTEHITNTKLHNLIDQAEISTTFATDKSSAQPAASDVFMFVQPGTPIWRKVTYNTMLLSATNLITSQAELDLPDSADFLLLFDTSAGSLAKVPLLAIFTNATASLWGPDYTNVPAGGFSYPYAYQGNAGRIEHSNLFAGFWQWMNADTNVGAVNPLTNSIVGSYHTALTNADVIMVWDKAGRTNKFTTLVGLVTNLPPVRPGLTNSDTFAFLQTRTNAVNQFGTNAVLSKMTLADLFTNLYELPFVTAGVGSTSRVASADTLMIWSTATNASGDATNFPAKVKISSLYRRYVTNNIPLGTGLIAQGLHGLVGAPQVVKWYLVCTNASGDGNYLFGDTVPIEDFESSAAAGTAVFAGGANNLNVFLTQRQNTVRVCDKASTSFLNITIANWNAMCVAEFWPHFNQSGQ